MSKTSDQSEAARTEALKEQLQKTSGMPVDVLARGGRSLTEEATRFAENAQAEHAAASAPREK